MNKDSAPYNHEIIIAGGGPVGLFLACCLCYYDIPCIVLEKHEERISHSRSLGIHPVSLELFEKIGLAKAFVREGIKIRKGHAFSDTRKIGTISFDACPPPYNFILSLPQYKTEELLEEYLLDIDPDILRRGVEVTGFNESHDHISVTFKENHQKVTITGIYLVGCDGKDSFVRRRAGIGFEGSTYPDTYIMGDFGDNTNFESDAAIFLSSDGLVESFPLSGGMRRWVIKTEEYISEPVRRDIELAVAQRVGHDLGEVDNSMLSSFGVQKLIASTLHKNRVLLAGDAAHIVSPIGGQGMNLGWLDAWDLCQTIRQISKKDENEDEVQSRFEAYSYRRLRAAGKAIRRAELNMRLGRKPRLAALRNALVWIMINTPLSRLMARLFTMRKLNSWWI